MGTKKVAEVSYAAADLVSLRRHPQEQAGGKGPDDHRRACV